jgi:hypothetical protein
VTLWSLGRLTTNRAMLLRLLSTPVADVGEGSCTTCSNLPKDLRELFAGAATNGKLSVPCNSAPLARGRIDR